MFARWFKKSAPSRRPARFAPSMEALEDRSVPAVTAALAGGTLLLQGGGASETATVSHDGNGNIVVTATGLGTQSFSNISKVEFDMNGGNDLVTFNQGSSLSPVTQVRNMTVEAHLGGGDDTFQANLFGSVTNGATMRIDVDGDSFLTSGNDVVTIRAGNLDPSEALDSAADFDVQTGSTLSVNVIGDGGSENIDVFYQGELDGALRLNLDGQSGGDDVAALVDIDAGSTGHLLGLQNGTAARVSGGSNDDDLRFQIDRDPGAGPVSIFAVMDGGSGNGDLGVLDENVVTVVNVEDVVFQDQF
jgi:hypothetical protein